MALGTNTMPADALAPTVARASAGMIFTVLRTNNMHCCSRVNFIYLGQAKFKIQDTIQNMNVPFVIFQIIQQVTN